MLIWHLVDDAYGFNADGADAHEQINNLFFVIFEAVGVELFADGGVFGFALFVAVQHPFQGGAVAELVLPRFGGDAAEGGEGIDFDAAVGATRRVARTGRCVFDRFEAGFVGGARVFRVFVVALQRVRFDGFVVEVELHELLAPAGPLPEVVVEGDAGEFALEVELVFGAVGGVVQHGVDVVEDVLLR